MSIYLTILCMCIGVVLAQEKCRTPNGDGGTCILLEDCEPLNKLSESDKQTREDLLFLKQSNCGLFMKVRPKVCCPPKDQWGEFTTRPPFTFPPFGKPGPGPEPAQTPSGTTLTTTTSLAPRPTPGPVDPPIPESDDTCKPSIKPPEAESFCCGMESSLTDRIIGGKYALPDQYPWLALLEYNNTRKNTPCGGALISSRYVLTAAHCLGRTSWGTAVKVRLAEYNTSTYPTDEVDYNGGIKFVTVAIIPIQCQIQHPGYVKNRRPIVDDIGLVKLTRNAPYTDFIRPICLPVRDVATMAHPEEIELVAAGWGSDGNVFSEVKKEIYLPFVPLKKCQNAFYNSKERIQLRDTHMCAGGEKDMDTCGGDSGGPLMYLAGDTYIVVGIVSFGSVVCGTEGKPGVYTNVYQYLGWLNKHMM